MAYPQEPGFVFRRNGRVHLNRRGRQFSRVLTADVCVSAVVMLDTPCSEVVWRVLATNSIRHFPLHFPSRAVPCAITFQLESTCPWHLLTRQYVLHFVLQYFLHYFLHPSLIFICIATKSSLWYSAANIRIILTYLLHGAESFLRS